MKNHVYEIRAFWDDEAAVWVATSDDVPGLVTESPTYEALMKKLVVLIPELLEANGVEPPSPEIPFSLLGERKAFARHTHT
jgi:predicted RNase H-like HicB family nuclease